MQGEDSETWIIRGLFGALVSLFLTWLMSRISKIESSRVDDADSIAAIGQRITVVEGDVKKLYESELRNSQAISKIADSTTRIESALLGFGGKGGLISTMESLAVQVQELTHNKRGVSE